MESTPTLETARLKLRPHRLEDFPAMTEMWADPAVTRFIGGIPSTEQQSWMRLLNYRGHWELLGFGFWAVEEKASGSYVGELGFADFKRELTPSIRGIPEMGWALSPKAHGKGYATEGIGAAIAWGDSHFGKREFACIIEPGNAPSLRLAAKFGFREKARTTYNGSPILLFSRV